MPNPLYVSLELRLYLLMYFHSAALYNNNPTPLMPPAIIAPIATAKARGKAAKGAKATKAAKVANTPEDPCVPQRRPILAQR